MAFVCKRNAFHMRAETYPKPNKNLQKSWRNLQKPCRNLAKTLQKIILLQKPCRNPAETSMILQKPRRNPPRKPPCRNPPCRNPAERGGFRGKGGVSADPYECRLGAPDLPNIPWVNVRTPNINLGIKPLIKKSYSILQKGGFLRLAFCSPCQ